MKGLIIRSPWIDDILDGRKTWEIRGSNLTIRGPIELIRSKSGLVVGSCEIVGCIELTLMSYQANQSCHLATDLDCLPYRKTYAWVIQNPVRYRHPRRYDHPNGAVVWVRLD
jgi:hypothetical protein